MTVNEVSKLTGLTIRTLQYYDRIGLFKPSMVTDAGYRIYDGKDLETLFQIMMFRELEMPLKDIKRIVTDPSFDRTVAESQDRALSDLPFDIYGFIGI